MGPDSWRPTEGTGQFRGGKYKMQHGPHAID
jgi:hypothetical protein